jgi:hypothetical protein
MIQTIIKTTSEVPGWFFVYGLWVVKNKKAPKGALNIIH